MCVFCVDCVLVESAALVHRADMFEELIYICILHLKGYQGEHV
jgi:hypothetical protein